MYFLYKSTQLNLFLAMLPIMITFFGIANVIPISTSQALSPYGHIAGIASAELGFFQMSLASLTTFIVALINGSVLVVLPYVFFVLSLAGFLCVCIDYVCIKFNKW